MFEKHLKIVEQIAVVFVFAVIVPMSISGFIINNINQQSMRHQLREAAVLIANMVSDEIDFFNKTAFSKYLPYEYQTTGSNEPLIAEFNVYFLHCTAFAYLLILSLYRIMHDDTVKKQNFV